jgi:hypothetical protein
MFYTYEWVHQMMTEFGVGPGSEFRIEGEVNHVQGPCAVLIHSRKASYPEAAGVRDLASHLAKDKNIGHLLVFVNDKEDPGYFGSFFGGVRGTGVECMPQNLGDLAFNVLTATLVYLEFRDRLSWGRSTICTEGAGRAIRINYTNSIHLLTFAPPLRGGPARHPLVLDPAREFFGQIHGILNQRLHPNVSSLRIPQEHMEGRYQHAALELGDVVLLEFFGEPEATDHPVLGEAKLEPYLQELFSETLRLFT